jgi:hypothetical protein
MTLALVHLGPGGCTVSNEHAGFELALPLSGSIELHFQEAGSFAAEQGEILHYSSERSHVVQNPLREPTDLLVIRFSSPRGRADISAGCKIDQ